jgi:hypothetical protein
MVGDRPAWQHDASGVLFRQVPAGTFQMGLSDAELTALRQIADCGEADADIDMLLDQSETMRPVRR